MLKRLLTFLAGLLVACQPPLHSDTASPFIRVGVQTGIKTLATAANISSYVFKLKEDGTNALVQTVTSGSPAGGFRLVPNGTYYLEADALDSSGQTLVVGGPQASPNKVTVVGNSTTYSSGTYLAVTLTLVDTAGASIPVSITAPFTTLYSGTLHADGVGPLASYDSAVSAFQFKQLADGTYYLWGKAKSGAGTTTLARPVGPVTVTSGTPSGSFSLSLNPLLNTVVGRNGGGEGVLATQTAFHSVSDVAFDSAGNAFVSDGWGYRIAKINRTTGVFNTVVGNGSYPLHSGFFTGSVFDGGPAGEAALEFPTGLEFDASDNLIFADTQTHYIRMVPAVAGTYFGQAMAAGDIYSVAGTGGGFLGSDLAFPRDAAWDSAGNAFFTDTLNHKIKMRAASTGAMFGQAVTAGSIYTLAGDGTNSLSADGTLASGAQVAAPERLVLDSLGNVIFTSGHSVCMIPRVAGTYYNVVMANDNLYRIAGDGVAGYLGDGGNAVSARLQSPQGLTLDTSDHLYIADKDNHAVRLVNRATGLISTLVGNGTAGLGAEGGAATGSCLSQPVGVALDGSRNLLIADSSNKRLRVVPLSTAGTYFGQVMAINGIYTIAGNGNFGFSGDGGPADQGTLHLAKELAAADDYLAVSDDNFRVRLVARTSGTLFGIAVTAGRIYSLAGNGTSGFAGDGGASVSAQISALQDMTTDSLGNLYLADSGSKRIRMIPRVSGTYFGQAMVAGRIYTVAGDGGSEAADGSPAAAGIGSVGSVWVDRAGHLYFGSGGKVRVIPATSTTLFGVAVSAGNLYTVAGGGLGGAGGPALSASIPVEDLAVDDYGNLAILGGNRVWLVPRATGTSYGLAVTANNLYLLAGDAANSYAGDGGVASAARFHFANSITTDPMGNLLVSDSWNGRIRLITQGGVCDTVAGNGQLGSKGDGGLPTSGRLDFPGGLALAPDGTLFTNTGSTVRSIQ